MFQKFDSPISTEPETERSPRQAWMALLARAPIDMLTQALSDPLSPAPIWLRRPETGLMMVQGRAGGTAERFNLGELTVTRCALRLNAAAHAPVGVAYVMGRNHQHATLAAMADALLQDPQQHDDLQARLLVPVRQHLQAQQTLRQQRALSTQVDFLTVAREAGGGEGDDPDNGEGQNT